MVSRPVVYNFVLSQGHTVEINGTVCATLGHGFKGQNIEHPYFGSQMVVDDLMRDKGWKQGLVKVDQK